MWIAAARLSRRRTCDSSCARIASICASSRRSPMPRGHNRTGPQDAEDARLERAVGGDQRRSDCVMPPRCSSRRRMSSSRPSVIGVASGARRPRRAASARTRRTRISAQPASQIAGSTNGSAATHDRRRAPIRPPTARDRRLRERLGHRVRRRPCVSRRMTRTGGQPAELTAERDQRRERDQELQRRGQPQPVPHLRAVAAERERQQCRDRGDERRLPEMVGDASLARS